MSCSLPPILFSPKLKIPHHKRKKNFKKIHVTVSSETATKAREKNSQLYNSGRLTERIYGRLQGKSIKSKLRINSNLMGEGKGSGYIKLFTPEYLNGLQPMLSNLLKNVGPNMELQGNKRREASSNQESTLKSSKNGEIPPRTPTMFSNSIISLKFNPSSICIMSESPKAESPPPNEDREGKIWKNGSLTTMTIYPRKEIHRKLSSLHPLGEDHNKPSGERNVRKPCFMRWKSPRSTCYDPHDSNIDPLNIDSNTNFMPFSDTMTTSPDYNSLFQVVGTQSLKKFNLLLNNQSTSRKSIPDPHALKEKLTIEIPLISYSTRDENLNREFSASENKVVNNNGSARNDAAVQNVSNDLKNRVFSSHPTFYGQKYKITNIKKNKKWKDCK